MGGIFSTSVLFALVCGVAVGGGIALPRRRRTRTARQAEHEKQKASERAGELIRFVGQRGSIAAIAGVVVLLLTRWAVAGIATAILVLLLGQALRRRPRRRRPPCAAWRPSPPGPNRCATPSRARSAWSRRSRLRRAAAPVLRPHLDALVDRLRSRTPLPEGLQHLADEINDASADIIVAALILNARLRGPGLRQVLGALAKSAREEVDMRQRVMAQRSSTRRSVQIVVAVSSLSSSACPSSPRLRRAVRHRRRTGRTGLRRGRSRSLLVAAQAVDDRDAGTVLVRDESSVRFVRPRTPVSGDEAVRR